MFCTTNPIIIQLNSGPNKGPVDIILGQSVSYSAISIGPQKEVLYSCRNHQFLGIALGVIETHNSKNWVFIYVILLELLN